MRSVSLRILKNAISRLEESNVSFEELFHELDVTEAQLRNSPRPGGSWETFCILLERIAEMHGGFDVLTDIGREYVLRNTGIFQVVAKRYQNPYALYYLGARWFGPMMFPGVRAELDKKDDHLCETVIIPPSLRKSEAFFWLVLGPLEAGPRFIGLEDACVELSISSSGRRAEYRIMVSESSAENEVLLSSESDFELALSDSEELLDQQVPADVRLGTFQQSGDLSEITCWRRVRAVIDSNPDGFGLTSSEIGRKLGMSTRTLGRLLSKEGCTVSSVREELRRDMAVSLLAKGGSIDDISCRLGYSESAAFFRAFRRWTGKTPRTFFLRAP